MKPIAKTHRPASWSALSQAERDLLLRLCVPKCDGIFVGNLVREIRVADALLRHGLVQWRDAVLFVRPEGLRIVVEESGLWSRRTG